MQQHYQCCARGILGARRCYFSSAFLLVAYLASCGEASAWIHGCFELLEMLLLDLLHTMQVKNMHGLWTLASASKD